MLATYHTELIDGQEIEKPLPKKLHALIQSFLIIFIGSRISRRYFPASELNIWCGPDRLVPDVTVTSRNAQYRDGDLIDPALLCIEIMSPGQTLTSLLDKCDRILKAGTPTCWVIWPERRKVWTYTKDDLVEEHEQLHLAIPPESDLVEENLSVTLTDLWAELDAD